jgi:hypothetical protein
MPSLARHEWAMRISEFVLGYGPRPTTKFQQYIPFIENRGGHGGGVRRRTTEEKEDVQ